MKILNISIKNKVASGDGTKIVCGNSDYIVKFHFDDEWNEYPVKTMRCRYKGKYVEQIFEGDEVELPIFRDVIGVEIGVYAGDLVTSAPAYFDCIKSILCGSDVHEEPPEDVYNQIIEQLGDIDKALDELHTYAQALIAGGEA